MDKPVQNLNGKWSPTKEELHPTDTFIEFENYKQGGVYLFSLNDNKAKPKVFFLILYTPIF